MSVIYFFIDGIGLGPADPERNPFTRFARSTLAICSGMSRPDALAREFLCVPVDAAMGIDGLPQSATGQTSLWTGMNAPALLGHHLTGFPGPRLRGVIEEHSILKRFRNAGYGASLLNAYSEKYLHKLESMPRLASASTHTQKASGQAVFTFADLEAGRALYMDITHHILHQYYPEVIERFPLREARERGEELVRLSHGYELAIFEYFLSDKAGHSQDFDVAQFVIETLEDFIAGACASLAADDTLIICTDHGNLEDLLTRGHTSNRVPLLVTGKLKSQFASGIEYLYDIPRRLYEIYSMPFTPVTVLPEPVKG